ncbi:hypothetical protein [Agrobacterium sp. RAC06]|uniref:hypothetical protein n=1 Tax=Agrobacterium sp. RAC06 TaxID=1842536 RepID=UPI0012374FA6|nr:hypothetical protein [Agrobacterium sp. RAC06]
MSSSGPFKWKDKILAIVAFSFCLAAFCAGQIKLGCNLALRILHLRRAKCFGIRSVKVRSDQMKKSLIGAMIVVASLAGGAGAQTAFDAEIDAVAAGCAADSAACVPLVEALITRARVAGALTPEFVTRMTVSLSNLTGPTATPALRASVVSAIQTVAAASPDPVQAQQVAQIAQTVATGGGIDTAAIGGAGASAL